MTLVQTEPKKLYIRVDIQETVQTFDFKNDGALSWTGVSGQYGTPEYVTGNGWKIGSGTSSYEGNIKAPDSIFVGTLKKYKIYFNKSVTTSSGVGQAAGIVGGGGQYGIQYSRFGGTGGRIAGPGGVTSAVDDTGDIILEFNFEQSDTIVKINNTNEYNIGSYSNNFKERWQNKDLLLVVAKRGAPIFYVSKVEITSL